MPGKEDGGSPPQADDSVFLLLVRGSSDRAPSVEEPGASHCPSEFNDAIVAGQTPPSDAPTLVSDCEVEDTDKRGRSLSSLILGTNQFTSRILRRFPSWFSNVSHNHSHPLSRVFFFRASIPSLLLSLSDPLRPTGDCSYQLGHHDTQEKYTQRKRFPPRQGTGKHQAQGCPFSMVEGFIYLWR